MSEIGDIVSQAASRMADARAAQHEQACEEAIQGGEFGVRINGRGFAFVDPTVPYGHRYYDPVILEPVDWRRA